MDRFPANDIMSLIDGVPAFDLAESVGPDLALRELLDPAELSDIGDIGDLLLSYGSAAGDQSLRQLIADREGVTPADVVITVGGIHGLFLVAQIICTPGSRVLTTNPLFPLTKNALALTEATVDVVTVNFDMGYQLNVDDLYEKTNEATRLISLASPQNPSGVALKQDTIQKIIKVMDEKSPDAFLMLDETYREAVYGEEPTAPSAIHIDKRIITSTSLSKCHGAPGLRIGWAITKNAMLKDQLIRGKFNTVISCSVIDEALALRLLRRADSILRSRRKRLGKAVDTVAQWVNDNETFIEWIRPDAGALCCIRLRQDKFDTAAIDRFYRALGARGVRVANGSWFGESDDVFRLGFGFLEHVDLKEALKRVAAAFRECGQ